MIEAYGDGPDPLPAEVASLSTIWHRPRDFRTGGLEFDSGFGVLQIALDADNSPYTGSDGWSHDAPRRRGRLRQGAERACAVDSVRDVPGDAQGLGRLGRLHPRRRRRRHRHPHIVPRQHRRRPVRLRLQRAGGRGLPGAPRPRARRRRRPRTHRRDARRVLHRLSAGHEPPGARGRQEAAVPPAHRGVPAKREPRPDHGLPGQPALRLEDVAGRGTVRRRDAAHELVRGVGGPAGRRPRPAAPGHARWATRWPRRPWQSPTGPAFRST